MLHRLLLVLVLTGLPGLVESATGITRAPSSTLSSLAAVRAVEIQTTFGHRPMPELSRWSWGEVIAWNRGYADPEQAAVNSWMNSPPHRAILVNAAYTHIGCGHAVTADKHFFVCLFGIPPTTSQPPPPVQPPPAAPPLVDALPDTGMPSDGLEYFMQRDAFILGFLLAPLVALALIAASRWMELEQFVKDNDLAGKLAVWRKRQPTNQCPQHRIRVPPRKSCPVNGCGWRPPR